MVQISPYRVYLRGVRQDKLLHALEVQIHEVRQLNLGELWKYHAESRYMRKWRYTILTNGSSRPLNKNGSLPFAEEESGHMQPASVSQKRKSARSKMERFHGKASLQPALSSYPLPQCDTIGSPTWRIDRTATERAPPPKF